MGFSVSGGTVRLFRFPHQTDMKILTTYDLKGFEAGPSKEPVKILIPAIR
jgi:hypothetical protein